MHLLDHNEITGTIPNSLSGLKQLEVLWMRKFYHTMKSFKYFYFFQNRIYQRFIYIYICIYIQLQMIIRLQDPYQLRLQTFQR